MSIDRRGFLRASGTAGLAGVVGLAGCTGGDGSGGSSASPGADPVTTGLAVSHYPVIPGTVHVQVAREKGFFADHGVEVEEVTSFSGGGTTVRGIVTGGLAAGNTALPALVNAFEAGAPIYLVGLTMAVPDIDFEVVPDSGIESIRDVAGKTVAVSNPGSSSEALAIRSIQNAEGVSLDEVEILHAGGLGEAITATTEGRADVTWNIPPKSTTMLDEGRTRRVWHSREYAPNVTEFVVAMGGRVLDERPALAEGVMGAYLDAYEFVKENVEAAAAVWADTADIPESVALRALRDVEVDEMFNVELEEEILDATAETMIAQGLVDDPPDWGAIVRQDPLPEEKRVDWPG